MKENSGAVLVLTRQGMQIGDLLCRNLPHAVLYYPERLAPAEVKENIPGKSFKDWTETVRQLFPRCSFLIVVGAVGIAVRSIAPLLDHKWVDPPVVVVDEGGRNSVSLLSGHCGGANSLAQEVAKILGGYPVITTATDEQGIKYPPDVMAQALDGLVEFSGKIKQINRQLAEGEKVNLYSPLELVPEIRQDYQWRGKPGLFEEQRVKEPSLVVTPYQSSSQNFQSGEEVLVRIKPRCLIMGVGCRRGVSREDITTAAARICSRYSLDPRCIKLVATLDIKMEEQALQEFCEEFSLPLKFYSRQELDELEGSYSSSPRVQKLLGVGGVCEPAAKRAARGGPVLAPKEIHGKVTVSVALENSWWWDWGPGTEIS